MNREDIYQALFDRVAAAPGLITTARKLRHWDEVEASAMPALFQAQGNQEAMVVTGQPTRWVLSATLWLYVSTLDIASPGEAVNPLVDFIADALALSPAGHVQTLGGLVHWARIEGTIETSEGTLGDKEVLRIPIKILAT